MEQNGIFTDVSVVIGITVCLYLLSVLVSFSIFLFDLMLLSDPSPLLILDVSCSTKQAL